MPGIRRGGEEVTYFEPEAGMIINYGYLWARQAYKEAEGEKIRPSLILDVANVDGKQMVYVSPLTHTPPFYPENSLLLPLETKERLKMDGQNSWLMLDEVNKFEWPGPDLRGAYGKPYFGRVPAEFLKQARDKLVDLVKMHRFKTVVREITQPANTNVQQQPAPKKAYVPAPQPTAS